MRARRMRQWMVLRQYAHLRPSRRKYLCCYQTGVTVHLRHRKGREW